MYIERCKHGSEGGLYKPTIEIWQGGTFLPYSYISMHKENWQRHSYAAACGVSDRVLFQMLEDVPNIRKVYLCLDNDAAGQSATNKISLKLYAQGIPTEVLVPSHKDWNEDLLHPPKNIESEVNTQCQALRL